MIIGLTGYAQSGKDSVARTLVEHYGFTRLAFADKIREMLYYLNPLVKDGFRLQGVVDAYGWDQAKVLFPEVRKSLQELGVSARYHLGPDVWVHAVLDQMTDKIDYVITDVRFENEATMIKKAQGELWRVKRPGVSAVNNHVSESELDGYKVDKILSNGGTLEELELLVHTRIGSPKNDN
jgi:cytidylate kinase